MECGPARIRPSVELEAGVHGLSQDRLAPRERLNTLAGRVATAVARFDDAVAQADHASAPRQGRPHGCAGPMSTAEGSSRQQDRAAVRLRYVHVVAPRTGPTGDKLGRSCGIIGAIAIEGRHACTPGLDLRDLAAKAQRARTPPFQGPWRAIR